MNYINCSFKCMAKEYTENQPAVANFIQPQKTFFSYFLGYAKIFPPSWDGQLSLFNKHVNYSIIGGLLGHQRRVPGVAIVPQKDNRLK